MIGKRDQGVTGNFEVTIAASGELIHSKSKYGQGKCETDEETEAVIEKVRAYLDSL